MDNFINPLKGGITLPFMGAEMIGGPGPGAMGCMTPDALMSYCQVRLGGLDSQMNLEFAAQEKSAKQQQQLNDVQSILSGLSGGICVDDNSTIAPYGVPHTAANLLASIQGKIDDPNTDPAVKEDLIKLRSEIATSIGGDNFAKAVAANPYGTIEAMKQENSDTDFLFHNQYQPPAVDSTGQRRVGADTVSTWISTVKDMSSDFGNDAQMGMIRLQSLMSERQTAIQICTNLIQSLGDQANKIAANVGH